MISGKKKNGSFVLLLVATLFVQNATGALEPMLESSYYDGYVFYYEDSLFGRIDFAVYDTEHPEYGDEYLDVGITAPGDERYIYAYQIFNDLSLSEEAVAYFALLDINGNSINIDSIGSQEDLENGVEPGSAYFNEDESRIVWEFDGGTGYIFVGEHSWFLVFSSDKDWVPGSYEIKGPDNNVPIPEPSMIALLGLGTAMMMRRKRSIQ